MPRSSISRSYLQRSDVTGPVTRRVIFYTFLLRRTVPQVMTDHSLHIAFPETTSAGLSVCDTNPGGARGLGRTSADGQYIGSGDATAPGRDRTRATSTRRPNCASAVSRPSVHRRTTSARGSIAPQRASAAGEGHAQLAQSLQTRTDARLQGGGARRAGRRRIDRHAARSARSRDAPRRRGSVVRAAADVRVLYRCTAPRVVRAEPALSPRRRTRHRDEFVRGRTKPRRRRADDRRRYLRIALLATAKPNQLRQKDLSAVFNALDQWTPRIRIGAPADDTLFVVDLDADAPPSYRELGSHTGTALRGISTDVLVYELEAYLAEMASDVPVPDYVSPDLLRHLAHAWGMMKKRSFRRSRSSGTMKICIGMRTLHYYVSGGVEFAEQLGTTEALLRREINPFMRRARTSSAPAQPGRRLGSTGSIGGARIPVNPNIERSEPDSVATRGDRRPRCRSQRATRATTRRSSIRARPATACAGRRRCRSSCRPGNCSRFANARTRAGASRCRAGSGTATRRR